jgi:FixJ family two-component response regulator
MRSENSAESDAVCLFDDDPLVLNSPRHLLASDGIATRSFDKAETFLAHIEMHAVALVVLGIWMELVTGLEVLARLCVVSPQTRVIVITARDDLAAKLTALQLGVTAFFTKPFDDDQFLNTVRARWQFTLFNERAR